MSVQVHSCENSSLCQQLEDQLFERGKDGQNPGNSNPVGNLQPTDGYLVTRLKDAGQVNKL